MREVIDCGGGIELHVSHEDELTERDRAALVELGKAAARKLAARPPKGCTTRLPCQVCGQELSERRDGLAKKHGRGGLCPGTGYQLARWRVGQQLVHHAGSTWEVVEDIGGPYGDYRARCIAAPVYSSGQQNDDQVGVERVLHGEYLHRHGWRPLPRDLMRDLRESLQTSAFSTTGEAER